MEDCCQTKSENSNQSSLCPVCLQKGKNVSLITLKALLQPAALQTITPESSYAFCSNPSCDVVYFSDKQAYVKNDLKVSVFQKEDVLDVPVCYCFGWTRERLIEAVQEKVQAIDFIREQVQANRCGCEVNNPQGSCCLGNVTKFIRNVEQSTD